MASSSSQKGKKSEHLLAVRIKPALMDKLQSYALKRSERENRRVSYREIIEKFIMGL
jgi:hypothetical protein